MSPAADPFAGLRKLSPGEFFANDELSEFLLTDREALVLFLTKLWLLRRDIESEVNTATTRYVKSLVFSAYAVGGTQIARHPYDLSGIRDRDAVAGFREAAEHGTAESWATVAEHAGLVLDLWAEVRDGSRVALLFIELAAFSPVGDELLQPDRETRDKSLEIIAGAARGTAAPGYLMALDPLLEERLNDLSRRRKRWGRIAGVAIGGASIGALSGGLAAPALGSAIGGSMGLGGAAATNAGLALLGGGSLASGGFGMAGGTAVVTAASAATGALLPGAAASAVSGLGVSPGQLAADLAKLEVLTEKVVLAQQRDRSKATLIARRCAELQESAAELNDRLGPQDPRGEADELSRSVEVLTRATKTLREISKQPIPERPDSG